MSDEVADEQGAKPAKPLPRRWSVSPEDGSYDRVQSDTDQAALLGLAAGLTDQAATNQQATSDKLDELLLKPAVAVSPKDQSSDREQSDLDQVLTIERLDRLIEASVSLSGSAEDIANVTRQEIRTAARARKRFMISTILMIVIALSLLIPLLAIGVSGIHARNELRDCVQPTGKCFQDAQIRTGNAVSDLNKVTLLAAACAPDYAGLPLAARTVAISKCIAAGLK